MQGVTKEFSNISTHNEVDITIGSGEIVRLAGPNGSENPNNRKHAWVCKPHRWNRRGV